MAGRAYIVIPGPPWHRNGAWHARPVPTARAAPTTHIYVYSAAPSGASAGRPWR